MTLPTARWHQPRMKSVHLRCPLWDGGALLSLLVLCAPTLGAQETPEFTLRPERTQWMETSRYTEVMDHLTRAAALHPRMHLTTFGYTNEGRALPLLVVGPDDPTRATPEAVRDTEALRIYIKGNIHAGEVAGKEALLRLIRTLALEPDHPWSQDWILLLGPIYNADGNERLDLRNRPRQHGPLAGMGTRPNAQGLDLNRDQMKLDSPEARSFASLLTEWDPHVVIDLHVTNGTRHAYHLTYAPGLHPATPASIDGWLREDLLPAVTQSMEDRWGWHMWHYGNVMNVAGVRGWWTFDHRPRFVTNYAGIRNRISILSEAYSYLTFEDRVLATERFVDEILTYLHAHQAEARSLVEEAVRRDVSGLPGTRIPLQASLPAQPAEVEILMGSVSEEIHPFSGEIILLRDDVIEAERMPAGIAFEGSAWEVAPRAYLLSPDARVLAERLSAHGIQMEILPVTGWRGAGQRFRVDAVRSGAQPFQGRTTQEVEGRWMDESDLEVPSGGWRIPVDQPLGRLLVLLMEPRADDGLAAWGFLDPWLSQGRPLPFWREP
jgi:hypothetical protein